MSDSSERSSTPPPAPDAVPATLAARWEHAGGRLFGPLTMDPELYQQVVLALAELLDALRAVTPSAAALLEASEQAPGLARDVLTRAGGDAAAVGIDPELLAQAALAHRLRELRPVEQARRRLAALAAAPTGSWIVLEESGDPDGDQDLPYRRIEADPASGRALVVFTEPAEDDLGCDHRVLTARVDLQTGELTVDAPDEQVALADATTREQRAAQLRRTPDRTDGQD